MVAGYRTTSESTHDSSNNERRSPTFSAVPHRLGTRSMVVSKTHRQVVPPIERSGVMISSSPRRRHCTAIQRSGNAVDRPLQHGPAAPRNYVNEGPSTPIPRDGITLDRTRTILVSTSYLYIIAERHPHASKREGTPHIDRVIHSHSRWTILHVMLCPHHAEVLWCPSVALAKEQPLRATGSVGNLSMDCQCEVNWTTLRPCYITPRHFATQGRF